jgi:hypothetical protein
MYANIFTSLFVKTLRFDYDKDDINIKMTAATTTTTFTTIEMD